MEAGRFILDLDDALACEQPPPEDGAEVRLPIWANGASISTFPCTAPYAIVFQYDRSSVGVLDLLQADPNLCTHLEMETYTWEVLPPEFKSWDVVDQLVAEYEWTLERLAERELYTRINKAA